MQKVHYQAVRTHQGKQPQRHRNHNQFVPWTRKLKQIGSQQPKAGTQFELRRKSSIESLLQGEQKPIVEHWMQKSQAQQAESPRRHKAKTRNRDIQVQEAMLRTFANTLNGRNVPFNDTCNNSNDSLLEHISLQSENFSDKVQVSKPSVVIVKNQRAAARGRNGRPACLPIPQVNLIDNLQSRTIDHASTRKPVNLYKQLMESQNIDLKRNKKVLTHKLMQHLHLYKGRQMASHTKSQTLEPQRRRAGFLHHAAPPGRAWGPLGGSKAWAATRSCRSRLRTPETLMPTTSAVSSRVNPSR